MAEMNTGGIPFEFKHRDTQPKPQKNAPFNLLILGNFSGPAFAARKDFPDLKQRPWYRIDCDDVDEVMAKLAPTLLLNTEGERQYEFAPSNLDDFHPDELYANFPPFQELKKLRRQLDNNATFAEAAKTLEQWLGIEPIAKPQQSSQASVQPKTAPAAGESLLDSILDASDDAATPPLTDDQSTNAWLKQMVNDAVAPYSLPAKDPRKEDYLALLDRSISDLMRALIHQKEFKSLETHWRCLDFLLRRSESESKLNIYIWDITKEELLSDLAQQGDATQSDFYQRIQQQFAASDEKLAAIVSSYEFAAIKQDALMIGILAKLCTQLNSPFIANGHASLAHSESFFLNDDHREWTFPWDKEFAQTWQAVRNMPESHYIALTAPRFLIRYPYDTNHYSIESFKFDEVDASISNEDLPWAPGAFAVASILAQSYNQKGWQFQLGDFTDLHRLPIAFIKYDDQQIQLPNGECFLTETMFNRLCDAGLTPITGLKNSDTLKVGPVLGLHERAALLGPWV